MDRPNVAIVNCELLDRSGMPATVIRPMNDDEFAEYEQAVKDAAEISLVEPPKPPLEQLADHLEALPPEQPVTASDLLAILRPDTMNADAPPSPTDHPATGA